MGAASLEVASFEAFSFKAAFFEAFFVKAASFEAFCFKAGTFEAFCFEAASFEAFSFKAASFENQLPISKQLEDRFPYRFLFTKPSLLHFFRFAKGVPLQAPTPLIKKPHNGNH